MIRRGTKLYFLFVCLLVVAVVICLIFCIVFKITRYFIRRQNELMKRKRRLAGVYGALTGGTAG